MSCGSGEVADGLSNIYGVATGFVHPGNTVEEGRLAEVRETQLPGVGARYEFGTEHGDTVGVIVHHGGHREVMTYASDDPDACSSVTHLTVDEAHALAELLGGSRVTEVASAVQHQIEGISIDWLTVAPHSARDGSSIADCEFRRAIGVSVVAAVRDGGTIPAPNADFVIRAGDVLVAVGPPEALEQARQMLDS